MKLTVIFFWISILFSTVRASAGAQGAETVFFYFAYQVDFLANGAGNTGLAKSCVGKTPGSNRLCTLNEFIKNVILGKHVNGYTRAIAKDPATFAILDTTDPDVTKAADALNKASYYHAAYEALRFNQYTKLPLFSNVYKDIVNRLQASRQTVATKGIAIDTQLAKIQNAFTIAQDNRIADQSQSLIRDLKNLLIPGTKQTIPGLQVETEPKVTGDGRAYSVIDTQATLTKSGFAAGSTGAVAVEQFVQDYPTKKGNSHQLVIDELAIQQNRVMGTPHC